MKSKLVLGTVQMGVPYGISNLLGQIKIQDSFDILKLAYESGIRTLDTAEAYGNAHEIIGKFHELNPSMVFEVITKLPHVIDDEIQNKVNIYLSQLKVQQLDSLLFHSFKTYIENLDKKHILKKLKESRIINKLGVSIYTNEEFQEVINDKDIDLIQIPYNIFDNKNIKGDLIELAKKRGKIVHTRSCFLQGLFFQPLSSEKPIVRKLKNQMELLNELSAKFNIQIQQLALLYCLQDQLIDNVLVGVDSVKQLKENIQLSDAELSPEVIQELNKIQVTDFNLLNPSLWNTL